MPITPIPKALYPLVPKVAGVPAVLRAGAQILDTLTLGFLGAGDLVNTLIGSEPILWGVFRSNGQPISNYDSVYSFDYQDSSRVSDYPVENGSFSSYNKVDEPFSVRVVLTCTGTIEKRAQFQADLRAARRSLELYTVVTEDGTYEKCNLIAIDWQRTAQNGAHMVKAFCDFREIRERGTTAFSQPADPTGAVMKDQGQLQPVDDPTIDASNIE